MDNEIIGVCLRTGCGELRDKDSQLYLCREHQAAVDAKKLGWIEDDRGYRRGRPLLEALRIV